MRLRPNQEGVSRRGVVAGLLATPMLAAGRLRMGRTQAADFTVSSAAELTALVASEGAAGLSGSIVQLNPGDYGLTIILDLLAFNPAQRVTFRAQSLHGTTTPGFAVEGSSKITFKNLVTHRLRVNDTDPDYNGAVNVVRDTTDIWFEDCEISSDSLVDVDFTGYVQVSGGSGTFIDGEAVTTNGGGSGVYRANRPHSSSTLFAITGADDDMSGNRNGGSVSSAWSGRTLTGVTSGATRTIAAFTVSSVTEFCYDLLVGIGPNDNNAPSTGLKVTGCYGHDLDQLVATSGADITVTGNDIVDVYKCFTTLNGDISNLVYTANRGINVWGLSTDGQPSGTGGPHSSLFGFSQRGWISTIGLIEGNAYAVGVRRAALIGGQGFATGPKMNDVPYRINGTMSGATLTVTGTYPSNGTISTSTPLKVGLRVWGTNIPAGTFITALGTGTGQNGTYILNNAATGPVTDVMTGAYYDGMVMRSNLFVCNGSIGIQFSSATNSEVAYNTVISDRTTNTLDNTKPSLYFNDWMLDSVAHGNVVNSFSNGNNAAGDISQDIDPSWFVESFDNVVAIAASSASPASYDQLYAGPNFTMTEDTTIEDVLAMFAAKPGSRIHGSCGHDAYYDFETNTGDYPVYVKPVTTVATGHDLTQVALPGGASVYDRCTKGASALWNMAATLSEFTFVWTGKLPDDSLAPTLMAATSALSLVRKTAANDSLITLTGGAAGAVFSIEGSLPVVSAASDANPWIGPDGLTTITFTVDLANYVFYLQVGSVIDPFVSVTEWTGGTISGAPSNMTLAAGTTGSPTGFAMTLGQFLFHDDFIDLSEVANQNLLVALDQKTIDFTANGSGLFGAQPRNYLRGNAAAWNTASPGLQLGSGTQGWIVNPAGSFS